MRVDPRSGDPSVPVDDPTGGSRLTRRLAVALPIAALVGLIVGIPLAFAMDEWRVVIPCVLGPMALVGTYLAILEDGRVQRRVDRETGRRG
jgi:hypothetical protein